jgi:chaperone modulatory protein CbpM
MQEITDLQPTTLDPPMPQKLSRQEFLMLSGLSNETLNGWFEPEWLLPAEISTGICFSGADLARARFIRDLEESMGINGEGIEVILDLVDQLHGVRRSLMDLRSAIQADPR